MRVYIPTDPISAAAAAGLLACGDDGISEPAVDYDSPSAPVGLAAVATFLEPDLADVDRVHRQRCRNGYKVYHATKCL